MSSIRVLRTFVSIAQQGSFAAAADKIGLTQSAVSLQMSALEDELRQSLFDRSSRTAKLNKTGRMLLPQIENIIRDYDKLRFSGAESGEISGPISIGAVVSAMGALSCTIRNIKALHPRVEFHLSTGRSNELAAKVLAGELDIALVVNSMAMPRTKLKWTQLYSEPMMIVAHRNTEDRSPGDIVSSEPFLRFDPTEQTGILVSKVLKKMNVQVTEFVELNSIEAIVDLVRQGAGVSILPLLRHSKWSELEDLRLVRIPGPATMRNIGLVVHRDNAENILVGSVMQRLIADNA